MATLIELAKKASNELKVGNPRTIATDTYTHNNRLIHEFDAAIEQMEKQEPVGVLAEDVYGRGQVFWYNKPNDRAKIYTHPAPAVPEETCNWYEGDDGGPWATQCNELFNIENEGPEANGMKFCCFCGKKLVEVVAEVEEEQK